MASVKMLHTIVWLVMAAAVSAVPLSVLWRRFDIGLAASLLVMLEGAVLLAHGGRCPLRTLAERLTDERRDGFDIHLPAWLARNTFRLFTPAFLIGEAVFWGVWLMRR